MREDKLFESDVAEVSTSAFHAGRPRAPHWEQPNHRPRLEKALTYCIAARGGLGIGPALLVDLGCGDGGLVEQLQKQWSTLFSVVGFDFQPSNRRGWMERGLHTTYALDFVQDWDDYVPSADIYVMTEVLEHLTDPHEMVRRVRNRNAQLVCSSPWTETHASHDECHAWAWDVEGYAEMIRTAGFEIREHEKVGMFQVVWAVPR